MKYNNLKSIRKMKGITQVVAAQFLHVSLRSYKDYENDKKKRENIKYQYLCDKLKHFGYVDEDNGVLTVDQIKKTVLRVLKDYDISYCYLYGNYAEGTANDKSSVCLLISSEIIGMSFFALSESLHVALSKRVELTDSVQLMNNFALINSILKDGIRIC